LGEGLRLQHRIATHFAQSIGARTVQIASSPPRYGVGVIDPQFRDEIRAFVGQREWGQFHTPENLVKRIAIEPGELLDCFQRGGDPEPTKREGAIADVLTSCLLLADRTGGDPAVIVLAKLARTGAKYPADRSSSRSTKYDAL
jgi:dCTP diphosphatase